MKQKMSFIVENTYLDTLGVVNLATDHEQEGKIVNGIIRLFVEESMLSLFRVGAIIEIEIDVPEPDVILDEDGGIDDDPLA